MANNSVHHRQYLWIYLLLRNSFVAIIIWLAYNSNNPSYGLAYQGFTPYWLNSNGWEWLAMIFWLINSHLRLLGIFDSERSQILSSFADFLLFLVVTLEFLFLNNLKFILLVPLVDSIFILRFKWQIIYSVIIYGFYLWGAYLTRLNLTDFWMVGISFFPLFLLTIIARISFDQNTKIESLFQELKNSYQALAQQANLAQQLGQQVERARIAGELHDEIGHTLVLLIARLDILQESFQSNQAPELHNEIAACAADARQILRQTKKVVEELAASVHGSDLFIDLENLVKKTINSSKINIRLKLPSPTPTLSPQLSGVIYRIVREGLTNAIRHGHPSEIRVFISCPAKDRVRVMVTDNGSGCKGKVSEGNGLKGLRECIAPFQGTITLAPLPDKGCSLEAQFPLL